MRRCRAATSLTVLAATALLGACSSGHPPSPPSTAPVPSTTVPTTTAPTTTAATRAAPTRATAARVPRPSARARAAGLRDVRSIVPDAVIDLRYATRHNFTHVRLYPPDARCLVHRSLAAGLARAAHRLRRAGLVLVFWDCYRPHAVQVRMFEVVADPEWVARPTRYARSHEAGRSVDVTLARARPGGRCATPLISGHCRLDMGTGFDDFTPRAHAYAHRGVGAAAERHRAILRKAMRTGGISGYRGEWWHFDGPGAAVNRPLLDAPVR
ncbi:D-alanyl-D-alanine dipeptidase [Jatrophihabitans endophyticus]|uniref:D-alanyl-D-alanine dipeptidase n=1 Tax=Jatrophihabitans endophyticus TaxID=1206085 RepID=A0A1M5UKZ5_9ACTN|nr:M15 family metallopeptidase [Jatrophihabitans endophyticus]SHH63621.1 D-alanyl-D-alanine dipeptidase [Jatrophihabitans endophyticus]